MKKRVHPSRILAGIIVFAMLCNMSLALLDRRIYASQSIIYIDGTVEGDGSAAAGTLEDPVKTFQQGQALLEDGGVLVALGTITVQGDDIWYSDANEKITIMRHESFRGMIIYIPADSALTLQNIIVDGDTNAENAAGSLLYVDGGSLTLSEGTVLQNNSIMGEGDAEVNGAGVCIYGGSLDMNDGCIIQNNSTHGRGGGIYADASTITMQGSTVTMNSASGGGGLFISNGTKLSISGGSVISGNSAEGAGIGGYGGAILATSGSSAEIIDTNTSIHENIAGYGGGGIYSELQSSVLIADEAVVERNEAIYGGGLFITGSDASNKLLVKNSAMIRNNTASTQGGGIYFSKSAQVEVQSGIVAGNYAGYGGAVYGSGRISFIGESTVESNAATVSGGGCYMIAETSERYSGTIIIEDKLTISGNTAENNGGGMYLGTGCSIDMKEDANIIVTGNSARNGAGMYAGYNINYNLDEQGMPVIGTMNFINNVASNNGGGIYKSGDMQLANGYVRGNLAGNNGGGIYMSTLEGHLTVKGQHQENPEDGVPTTALFGGNSAGRNGGGIYISDHTNLTLECVAFLRNTASIGHNCRDCASNHPEDWAVYTSVVTGNEAIKEAGFHSSIGDWIYNNFDVSFVTSCEDSEDIYTVLVQWIKEEEDGSRSVAYSYITDGSKGETRTLKYDDYYMDFMDHLGESMDGCPDGLLLEQGYRYVGTNLTGDGGAYTFGSMTAVQFNYLVNSKSRLPEITSLRENTNFIEGRGIANARIRIIMNSIEYSTFVDSEGNWRISLEKNLEEGDLVTFTQEETGKTVSSTAYKAVSAISRLPSEITDWKMRFYAELEHASEAGIDWQNSESAINLENTVQESINADENIYIRYDFYIQDRGIDISQEYTLVLPEFIHVLASHDIDILLLNGTVIANAAVTAGSRKIVITFNEIAGTGAIEGFFYFGAGFYKEYLDTGENEYSFEAGADDEKKIYIMYDTPSSSIMKSGSYRYLDIEEDKYLIEWELVVNDEEASLSNLLVTDYLVGGDEGIHEYVKDSTRITDMDNMDMSADWRWDADMNPELRWEYVGGLTSKTYIITFQTYVEERSFFIGSDKKAWIPNTAVLDYTAKGGSIGRDSDSDKVYIPEYAVIKKDGKQLEAGGKDLMWQIEINPEGNTLYETVVTDTLLNGMVFCFLYTDYSNNPNIGIGRFINEKYITDSVVFNIWETGDRYTVLKYGQDYIFEITENPDGTESIAIRFLQPVTKPYTIQLGAYCLDTAYLEEGNTISNEAVISWKNSKGQQTGLPEDDRTGIGTIRPMDFNYLAKYARGYNERDQCITWEIEVNLSSQSLTNVSLADFFLYDADLELYYEAGDPNYGVEIYTNRKVSGKEVSYSGVYHNYSVTYEPKKQVLFKYDISNEKDVVYAERLERESYGKNVLYIDLGDIKQTLYITFRTKVVDEIILFSVMNYAVDNYVWLYCDQLDGAEKNLWKEAYSAVSDGGIRKTYIGYEADTNLLTWSLVFNRSFAEFSSQYIYINDDVSEGKGQPGIGSHVFSDVVSFIYTKAIWDDDGNVSYEDHVMGRDSPAGSDPCYYTLTDYTYNGVVAGKTINIYNPGNYKMTMVVQTKIEDLEQFNPQNKEEYLGDSLLFKNYVYVYNSDRVSLGRSNHQTAVTKRPIKKEAFYQENNDFITWQVTVDTSAGVELPMGTTLTDNLQPGLVLDTDSIRIEQYTIDTYGGVAEPNESVIGFPTGKEISFDVEYHAPEDSGYAGALDENEFVITINEKLEGKYLYILTFDTAALPKETYNNTIVLSGKGIYGADSEKIKTDNYGEGSGGKNYNWDLTVVKADPEGNYLPGAKFSFYQKDNGGEIIEPPEELVTGDTGSADLKKLLFSTNYYLKEIKAPPGYLLVNEEIQLYLVRMADGKISYSLRADSSTPDWVSIVIGDSQDDGKGTITYPITVLIENEPGESLSGEIKFKKVDGMDYSTPLTGASFSLYYCSDDSENHTHGMDTQDGCWIPVPEYQNVEVDDQGVLTITELSPGDYALAEQSSPKGYELPQGYWIFTVEQEGAVTLKNCVGNPPAIREADAEEEYYLIGNTKKYVLPGAGSNKILIVMGSGALLMMAGVTAWGVYKRKKRKECHYKLRNSRESL